MAGDERGLSDFDERLLQGVFARVWRGLAEHSDSESQLNKGESHEELKRRLDIPLAKDRVLIAGLNSDIDTYLTESIITCLL